MTLFRFLFASLCLCLTTAHAAPIVNVYVWGGEIPKSVVHLFEEETGIKVNFSTYDSNETLYAKLQASQPAQYDVILPSAYYVERLKKQGLLTQLDHNRLPCLKNIDPFFINAPYDPGALYNVPLIWGATGIFYNQKHIKVPPKGFKSLWSSRFKNQLMILDDAREVFSMALLALGYNANDTDPEHIKEAYLALLKLIPNIKLFASDSIQAIMIDEDAQAGVIWNGDAYKAHNENKALSFVYPKEGFVIWVDGLAIPKGAPHLNEAYQFINFLLKPEIAAIIAKAQGHAITNTDAKMLLPRWQRNNPMVYPSHDTLSRAMLQRDVDDKTLKLYNDYWQKFKLAF